MTTPHKQQIYTVQEAARVLGIGSNTLFKKLRALHILDIGNVPYPRYVQAGYFRVERKHWRHPDTGWQISARTMVTLRGVEWIDKLINEAKNDVHQNPALFG